MTYLYETEMLLVIRVEANNVSDARRATLKLAEQMQSVFPVGVSALRGGDALSSTVRS